MEVEVESEKMLSATRTKTSGWGPLITRTASTSDQEIILSGETRDRAPRFGRTSNETAKSRHSTRLGAKSRPSRATRLDWALDATERHKPSQAVASEAHSLPPRLEHRAQSSSDLVNYTTQPPLPVPGLTPYRQRQPRAQQDLFKGMSPSLGPMPSGKLPSDSQRKTQSRRRSCESAHSSNSVLSSPEFDTKWPMLDSPAVAQPTLFSEGRVHSDLPRAGSMPARKVDTHFFTNICLRARNIRIRV